MKMITQALVSVLVLAASPIALLAAGGSSVPSTNPKDEAAAAYERGLAHRDKAWKLQKEAESSADEARKSKLEAKIKKEYEKAIRAFRSATESNPQMHQAYSSLGYALRRTGSFEESLEAYDRALQLQPDYFEAIEYRAEAYLALDRLAEAKSAYMQLFRDDRERADELMTAMQSWIETSRVETDSLDPSAVEAFSAWVEERQRISGNTASVESDTERAW